MKKLLVVSLLACLLAVTLLPVSAASWTERISGGMSYAHPYGEFTVTLSAWESADGTYGGQGQYYYPPSDRTFHLKVNRICYGTVVDGTFAGQPYVVAIGPVFGQDGTEVNVGYGAIAVAEGDDSPDGVRVRFDETLAFVEGFCTMARVGANNVFPALVIDGNFNIRSK